MAACLHVCIPTFRIGKTLLFFHRDLVFSPWPSPTCMMETQFIFETSFGSFGNPSDTPLPDESSRPRLFSSAVASASAAADFYPCLTPVPSSSHTGHSIHSSSYLEPYVPLLPPVSVTSAHRRDDLFSDSSERSSDYNSFFHTLRPVLRDAAPPTTYDNMWDSNPFQCAAQPLPSLDDILTQPPPCGHHLFHQTKSSETRFPVLPIPGSFQVKTAQLPTFGQFTTSDDFTMDMSGETPRRKRKDRSAGLPMDTPSPSGQTPKRPRPSLDVRAKLHKIFDLLDEVDWTVGDFLHHMFVHADTDKKPIHRSPRHAIICQRFLSGRTTHSVARILEAWMTSPDSHGYEDQVLFDTETLHQDIRPVRHALTAFAAQTSGDFLERESAEAVKPSAGLHTSIVVASTDPSENNTITTQWADLGSAVPTASRVLKMNQRVAFYFMSRIAEPKPRSRKGILRVRKSRPRDNVVAHCLSILDFCKNGNARLEPLARGILYLSSGVPVDIIHNNSRLASMPAVNTIKAALRAFSDQKAIIIRNSGRDVSVVKGANGRVITKAKKIIFDNFQHFKKQRDLRIGRENAMIIGIAATFFSFTVDAAALDVLDKRHRITHSRRASLTVQDLLAMIDQPHIKNIGILQFLESLSNYIPEAAVYKREIYIRYRTRVSKLQVPPGKADISTLATSGKNEASIAELKDGFLDFLEQLGQKDGDYDFRLFELLRPVLQLWHTFWTDLCEAAAKKLFETYVSSGARFQAKLDARDDATSWTAQAPLGAPWQTSPPSLPLPTKPKRKTRTTSVSIPKKSKKKVSTMEQPPAQFWGDNIYFDTGTFMHDAMISREAAAAAAQADVGRVWEALKVMVFTFAGSNHKKYMGYLLEMICDLELESNPFLKDATLMSMVLNPDGRDGNCKPCDIFQELLNRCIDPVVQRKDTDYGSYHVRNIWSRNIKDIYDLKNDFRAAVGLAERSGRHKKPHERPEVKILLREYRVAELHKRRPGRTFSDGRDVNNFQAGIKLLEGGALQNFAGSDQVPPEEESEHESDWSDESNNDDHPPMSLGDMHYEDGNLVITVSGEEEDDMIAVLQGEGEGDADSEYDDEG
ncbi:hypothetical protein B0H17DRAFT_1256751 [Mycena rosella]|uniref:DUF6589 domain-containing protein n=1 Tax=Mycena rosella TaxID=1033263 RepID=A0AAD7DTU2_MYCRO|nr:hypothetical protein B0H17DRAFT_1256751 [Mycena rosella]